MSDAKGSRGTPRKFVAAKDSGKWEDRLELARKQRAKALAKARQQPTAYTTPDEAPKKPEPVPDSARVEATPVADAEEWIRPRERTRPKKRQRRYSIVLIVLAAMLGGALLQWVAAKVTDDRQPENIVTRNDAPSLGVALSSEAAFDGSLPAGIDTLPSDIQMLSRYSSLSNTTVSPTDSPGRTTGPPELNFAPAPGGDAVLVYDPEPPMPKASIEPQYSEVKPLPIPTRTTGIEVGLFVPRRVSDDASNKALEALTNGKATVVATARVPYSVRETHVRYYHPDDAINATLAAEALGGIARDFTKAGSKTQPGRIEVYLAGRGGSGNTGNSNRQPTDFDLFIARLLDEIR